LLYETQDFSLTAELGVSTPTGTPPLAGNRTSLTPNVSLGQHHGTFCSTGRGRCPLPELIGQLAIGQTLTGHDVPFFGDFTYYLSTVVDTPFSNGDLTRVTLTPRRPHPRGP
jgi:hypothetical protein